MARDVVFRRVLTGAVLVSVVGLALPSASLAQQDTGSPPGLRQPFALVDDRDVADRLDQPEDRYALAGGCYTLEAPGVGFVTRDGAEVSLTADEAAATPLHLQPLRLGEYLLATNEGPADDVPDATWDDRGYLAAAGMLPAGELPGGGGLPGLPDPVDLLAPGLELPAAPAGDTVMIAGAPGLQAEFRIRAAGDDPEARDESGQGYVLDLPEVDKALDVADGALTLVDGEDSSTGFVLRHVADDDPGDDDPNGTACATWPEIETNTSGPPTPPGGGAAGEVEGFFESHVHGMAYEFLGGEARCGSPWHKYGVEFALPDCQQTGNVLNPATEAALAGQDPSTYDPVGWPTFGFWPQHDTLTHEQYYWKWLERAYHGGLRLTTNLLVDNTALCQVYPQKKNSCNEMDGVRLQAKRMFQFQEYIDAQYGGPGEGWLRIVTTPAEARRVINAGRMALVLGIEVSVLLDCGEILGVPQCDETDVDTRLQEVFDMGVRQMELINKFDNAFSGVTGDGGQTGVIVNQGNRLVTGHYWDMRTCPEEADDGHTHEDVTVEGTQYDKLQTNASDDLGMGETPEEIDVLAGVIIEEAGGVTSAAAPAYPAGPHCNAAGLTDLGIYVVEQMARKGMIIDPDHMSASGQRMLLDHVQDELVPTERTAAETEGRAVRLPSLISSHSWGNDVIYQRIHELAGQVAPRTDDAAGFVDSWAQNRAWSAELAPDDIAFGMGYGADTNGFGAQPGPRSDPATPFTYPADGWTSVIGDVQIFQQTSGVRTFDIATEGVAHYGMFADWFRELQVDADARQSELGGADAIMADMLNGPENYLQMWERAVYGGNPCVTDGAFFQPEDLHALAGGNIEGFMEAIGMPADREDSVYTYCAEGEGGEIFPMDVTFDEDGNNGTVGENPGTVTPVAAPAPDADAPPPAAAPAPHNDSPLPSTGGGLINAALLLLGLTAILSRRLWPVDE